MKNFDIRIGLIYIVLAIYLMLLNIVFEVFLPTFTVHVINPIFWLILLIVIYLLKMNSKYKIYNKINKFQVILIIMITYLILYFISGLFIGYGKNPIYLSFFKIYKNIWYFIIPIIGQEYIRDKILKGTKKNNLLIGFYLIIFILLDIDLYSFINSSTTYESLFKNISSILLPSIANNFLYTYLSFETGIIGILVIRLLNTLTSIILPILPNINWFIMALIGIIMPFIIYLSIRRINNKRNRKYISLNRKNTYLNIFIVFILTIFILFILGVFRYKPVVIMSNSMSHIIKRGDIVIIKKMDYKKIESLKEGEIIEYILDDIMIVHRIIHIEKHNNYLFITKGDNNETVDFKKVKDEQVKGVVRFRIKKIGYPFVWLNEYLK